MTCYELYGIPAKVVRKLKVSDFLQCTRQESVLKFVLCSVALKFFLAAFSVAHILE